MQNITKVSSVHWLNDSKTRVAALITWDNGTTEQLSITATDGSEFWEHVKSVVTIDEIDSNTSAIAQRRAEDSKISGYRNEERQLQRRQNAIFNAKIEAFDMMEVVNALPARKTKIRKAKSVSEVMAHVVISIIEYEEKQAQLP